MLVNKFLKNINIFTKNKQYQQQLADIALSSEKFKNNNILKSVKSPIDFSFSGQNSNVDLKNSLASINNFCKDPYKQAYIGYKYSCVEALNSSNPKELVFLLDNKTGECVEKAVGDAVSCEFNKPAGKRLVSLLHGHAPILDGTETLPVSLQDFIVLNNNKNITQIVAFDKKGKESYLKKLDTFEQLSSSGLKELKKSYMKYLLDNSPKKDVEYINSLRTYCKYNPDSTGVKSQIAKSITGLQNKEYSKELVNEFWKEKAAELNLEYCCEY